MMIDENVALIRSTVNNIRRYQRLLQTQLTVIERQFIERRLGEERAALDALRNKTFPMAFRLTPTGSETSAARS